ncbi:MAG TPA: cytochrome c [Acetobacteraceae bacterium]|nr:cytochrome c [Acetobacteraceae bacterium]
MTFRHIVAIALLAGGFAGTAGLVHAQGTDIVAAREDGMKATAKNAKAIKTALDAGADLAPLTANAQEIAAWGHKIPSMFPPGSDTGKTEALPAVWTHKADFDKHAGDLSAAADKLAVALAANDAGAAKAAFTATGQVCGACHRSYREKKK